MHSNNFHHFESITELFLFVFFKRMYILFKLLLFFFMYRYTFTFLVFNMQHVQINFHYFESISEFLFFCLFWENVTLFVEDINKTRNISNLPTL